MFGLYVTDLNRSHYGLYINLTGVDFEYILLYEEDVLSRLCDN
jgi:hypothetical protein